MTDVQTTLAQIRQHQIGFAFHSWKYFANHAWYALGSERLRPFERKAFTQIRYLKREEFEDAATNDPEAFNDLIATYEICGRAWERETRFKTSST